MDIKYIRTLTFVLLFIFITPLFINVSANSYRKGSLKLYSNYESDDETIILKEEQFEIYKIADYIDDAFINKGYLCII